MADELDLKPFDLGSSFSDFPDSEGDEIQEKAKRSEAPKGVYTDMSNYDYHNSKAISNSGLSKLDPETGSPAHLGAYLDKGSRRTAALDFGAIFHDITLMPQSYVDAHYAISPKYDLRNSKDVIAKENFYKDVEPGIIVINEQDYALAKAMRESVLDNPTARWLIEAAQDENGCENSHFWYDKKTYNYCRVRPDIACLSKGILGDLKSTADCSPKEFKKSVYDYNYHQQQAMYTDGVEQTTDAIVNDFQFIVTEKKLDLPITVIYRLDPEAVDKGNNDYRDRMYQYAQLLRKNSFYDPVDLSLPRYAFN